MISLESTAEKAAESSPLNLSPKNNTSSSEISLFSQLLNGITQKEDEKIIQNGAFVLALDAKGAKMQEPPLKQSMSSLKKNQLTPPLSTNELKSEEKNLQPLELNPQLTKLLSPAELKGLVRDAKKYLKMKIIESEGFKKAEIESLPKTLKGLVSVAKKFHLDVSKITYEEIQKSPQIDKPVVSVKNVEKPAFKPVKLQSAEELHQIKQESKEVKSDVAQKRTSQVVKLQSSEVVHQEKEEIKTKVVQKDTSKVQPQQNISPLHQRREAEKLQTSTVVVAQAKEEVKSEMTQSVASKKIPPKQDKEVTQELPTQRPQRAVLQPRQQESSEVKLSGKQKAHNEKRVDAQNQREQLQTPKHKEPQRVAKDTLLFKIHTPKEVTTEQLVQVRSSALSSKEVNRPKVKADETLKLLLRGEKVAKKESAGLTPDFSVATARVIAPTATTEVSKKLESLFSGEGSENAHTSKSEAIQIPKADSFDLKLHEAKQMTKYISADVKTAIEDYKSPFTRVKVQLNPERLGAVELTVVQRGKNLHINLSSNNAAINALAMNANDLKVQLTNNGINNATLNFNNSSQSSENSFSGGQQNSQQQREANREYNYFENEESSEEVLNSLEIVVPHYA